MKNFFEGGFVYFGTSKIIKGFFSSFNNMTLNERSPFTCPLFGTFNTALPFEYGPTVVIVLRELREDAWEVYFSIAYGTESTGALDPREIAAVCSGAGVRVELRVLHVEGFNAFVVEVDIAEVVHALEDEVMDVLVEGASKWDADVVCGRTSTFKMVNFPGSLDLVGSTVPVRITRGFVNSLRGELVES